MLQQRISVYTSYPKVKRPKLSRRLPKIAVTVFIAILLLLGMQRAAFAVLAAVEQSKQEWKSFRNTYPFHLQVIGLTSPLRDQSRVLLISEPPPDIAPAYFQKLANSLGGQVLFQTNPVGYDGWTKDVLLALPKLTEEEISNLLAQLYLDLYSTSYKANVVQLPVSPPPTNKRSLDLSISVADLNNWLNNKSINFTPLLGGEARSLSAILTAKQSGVFTSTQRGLVIWSIPRNQDLAKYRAEARQFFLDSDLIIGAVANNQQLAIIGRERVEPLLRLPPLRFETVLTLAAEKNVELAQSYERNNVFAGKLYSGLDKGKDWAPIYLSESLINTEFGSLLNITDQLLKSWSMNGEVQYFNFNYPKPSQWAKFPRPIRKLSEETGSILFNWNTAGAGYTTSIGSYDFFALNRTGALPIIYRTENNNQSKSVQIYEKIGYEYFAGVANSDLARVVQYTSLYQIFRQFGITTKSSIYGSLLPGNKVLALEAAYLLVTLQRFSQDEFLKKLQIDLENGKLSAEDANTFKKITLALNKETSSLRQALDQGTKRWQEKALSELAWMIASPRTYTPTISDPDFTNWVVSTYFMAIQPNIREFLYFLSNPENVKERYTQALSQEPNSWIKTPSIVLSQDVLSASAVGGHNLNSRLTRLQSSSKVPKGTVQIIKDGQNSVILHNPNDIDKIHSLSRLLATETGNPNITATLESALRQSNSSPRSLAKALNIPTEQKARGLSEVHQPPTSSSPLGWNLRDNPLTPQEIQRLKVSETLNNPSPSIIIERNSSGYTILRSGSDQAIEAHTLPSLYESLGQSMRLIASDRPMQISLNGFTPQEAKAFALTAEIRELNAQKAIFRQDIPFEQNIALLQRQYDWNSAKIQEVKVENLPDNPSAYRQIIDVEIDSRISTQPSGRMRIITSLKELPQRIVQRITEIIQQALTKKSPQARNVNQIISDIRKQLKQEFPDIDIEVQYNSEAGDIIITNSVKPNRYKPQITYAR